MVNQNRTIFHHQSDKTLLDYKPHFWEFKAELHETETFHLQEEFVFLNFLFLQWNHWGRKDKKKMQVFIEDSQDGVVSRVVQISSQNHI